MNRENRLKFQLFIQFICSQPICSQYQTLAQIAFVKACIAIFVIVVGVSVLSGCVTSEVIGSNLQKDPEKRVEVGMQAAAEYLKVNDIENALRHLNAVLELEPKNAGAHQTMALVYTKEGKLKEAEEFYKKSIRYDGGLSSARNNYATLLYSRGRYEDAIAQLEVAAADLSYDNRAQAIQNLGLCYVKLNRKFDAEASFQTALRLNPKLPRSLLELSDILLQQNQYKLAARYLREYSTIARHTPRSLWIGIQIEWVNRDENALSSYVLALRNLYPESLEYKRYMETRTNDR